MIQKVILANLNYVQCLNLAPIEKEWFFTPMEYSPNENGIMAPMEYKSIGYSPNGKSMVSWKILFRENAIKSIYVLHEVDKRNVTSSFQGIWTSLYFFLLFLSFHYHCQLVKVNCSKNLGGRGGKGGLTPQSPGFYKHGRP